MAFFLIQKSSAERFCAAALLGQLVAGCLLTVLISTDLTCVCFFCCFFVKGPQRVKSFFESLATFTFLIVASLFALHSSVTCSGWWFKDVHPVFDLRKGSLQTIAALLCNDIQWSGFFHQYSVCVFYQTNYTWRISPTDLCFLLFPGPWEPRRRRFHVLRLIWREKTSRDVCFVLRAFFNRTSESRKCVCVM